MAGTSSVANGSQNETELQPVYRRWKDYRRMITWKSPDEPTWGSRQGVYPPLETSQLQAQVVRIPAGQGAPLYQAPSELIIVQVVGQLDFTIGTELHIVKPFDMLVLPANTPHEVFNAEFEDALFFVVHDRPPAGEPYSTDPFGGAEQSSEPPTDAEITHLKWDDYRRQVDYRGGLSGVYGYHRGVYPIVETATMRGHPVRVPGGQGSPWKTVRGDAIYIGLVGEVEIYGNSFDEPEAYPLGPLDLLMMPPPVGAFQNPGLSDAVFFVVAGKSDGPFTMKYFQQAVAGNPLAGPGDEVPT